MLKHRHSSFSGEIIQNIPLLHFEMLAGLMVPQSTPTDTLYIDTGLLDIHTRNKLRILGLIFVQFIYLIFLVTEIFVTAKISNYDQNKTLDLKIQHLLDVRNYTRSRTPPN